MADPPFAESQSAKTKSEDTPGGGDSSVPAAAERVTSTQSFAPARLGPYVVLGTLGQGGMGVVYKARHSLLDRVDAVKVMSQAVVAGEQARKRFLREVRLVAALDHPSIVQAYGADETDGCVYLAMELVSGKNLKEIVDERGPLDWREACAYLRQAAQGLQHAHEKSMVHRDLKPGNLMLSENGDVKILDFGLATSRGELQEHLTDAGGFGTAAFMAPEQRLDARSVDIRADIYSLGATLYYLLAARTHKQAASTLADAIDRLRTSRPELPPSLLTLLERMMEHDRSRRPAQPREVADALSEITTSQNGDVAALPSPADAPAATGMRRRRLLLAGAATALLIVAGLAAWFGYLRDLGATPDDDKARPNKSSLVKVAHLRPDKSSSDEPAPLPKSQDSLPDKPPKSKDPLPVRVGLPTLRKGPAVDVVFVLDVTGSMGEQITGLADGIEPFLAALRSRKMAPRAGLVTFRDLFFDDPRDALQHHQFSGARFTADAKSFALEVQKLTAKGGGDYPESSLDALGEAADKLPWNDKATRVLVLITDALPQTIRNSLGWADLLAILKAKKIDQIHLVIRRTDKTEYEKARKAARGAFFDLEREGHPAKKFAKLLTVLGAEIATLARRFEPPYLPKEPGKAARVFRAHTGPVTCLAVAKDGRFVSGGADGTVRLWDIGAADEEATVEMTAKDAIQDVAFTPDGRYVLLAPGEATKPGHWNHLAWKINTPDVEKIELPGGAPSCYACDRGGKWIAIGRSAGQSGFITNVLQAPGVAAIYYFSEGPLYCSKIAISDDGTLVLTTGSKSGLVQLWAGDKHKGMAKHSFKQASAFPAVLSGPGTTALTLDEKDPTRVQYWDVAAEAPRRLLQLKGHTAPATCCAMSASASEAITGSADGKIRLWDLRNGAQLAILEGHEDEVTCLDIFPDGDYAVSGSRDGTLRLWNLAVARK